MDAHQETLDAARTTVLASLTPERLRETYRSAFAASRTRYTAVALLPKRTFSQRALAVTAAGTAAWADASFAARGGAVLAVTATGALAVAVAYARWRAWRSL